jgi:tetratricopeptide (TPR) repeat protein
LIEQGAFAEAAEALQKALDALPAGHHQRPKFQLNLQRAQLLVALERRMPLVLEGKASASPAELLTMADVCQRHRKRYAAAVRLYQKAFQAEPKLEKERYRAACAAALAAAGKDADKLDEAEKTALRLQSLDWLRADFDKFGQIQGRPWSKEQIGQIIEGEEYVIRAKADPDLSGLRDDGELIKLSETEQTPCRTLWQSADASLARIRAQFTVSTKEAALSTKEKEHVQEIKKQAGQTLAIDMHSGAFDTFLRLEDSAGKVLAENDDIVDGVNTNSRLIFVAPADGVYRIVATSFGQRGAGAYTLTIRDFPSTK